jgi:hypothetical protein
MPRTARTKKVRPTLTAEDTTPAKRSTKGHAADGKFIAGNPGGPGNPHARHCARMLALLRTCISDEDMIAIIRALVEKAKKHDTSAAKILFSYVIGKPAEAPNPDQIDRDEWEHYQKDTINLQEMQQVLGSLPAKVGNDIARTALPIMTEARTRELEAHLRKGCPISPEVNESTEETDEQSPKAPPLSNGESGSEATNTDRSTLDDLRASTREDSNRRSRSSRLKVRATVPDSRSTANRKSDQRARRIASEPGHCACVDDSVARQTRRVRFEVCGLCGRFDSLKACQNGHARFGT